jgi:ElaA protein
MSASPCQLNAGIYIADMAAAQHGFVRDGDDFLDDGVPHVPLLRSMSPPPPPAAAPPASSADEPGGPGAHS